MQIRHLLSTILYRHGLSPEYTLAASRSLRSQKKVPTLGPFLLFNAALIGFFAFAAIYHAVLWWSSRREILLAAFSADCAVRAVFSIVAVMVSTATTTTEAQSALHARISVGILIMLTWVWNLTLISGVKARWFVWPVTAFLIVLFPLHTFFLPLNSTVVSIETFQFPWGETVSNPQLTAPHWWFGPLYSVVMSIELFGLYCGLRLWMRDRVAGTLILLANNVMLLVHGAHVLKAFGVFNMPFLGMIGHFFWACLLCVLFARRHFLMQKQLVASEQRLESLSRQLITAQESERRRLARELHDQIGQMLTAIKMNLRRTQRMAPPEVGVAVEENVQLVDVAIGQVRNLSLSLRPPQLDELGLVAALHWLVKHQAQLGGFEEQLDIDLGGIQIPPALETACFRIAQEALTNTVRHGHASKVYVKLQGNENKLLLMVRDNGVGFEVDKIRARALSGGSIGLISMQERANLASGQIEIDSNPGHGTRIQAVLQMSGESHAKQ